MDYELLTYFQSHSIGDCVRKFGLARATIKKRLRKCGIDTSKSFHKLSISDDDLIKCYSNQGNLRRCANIIGCSISAIRKRLRNLGVWTNRLTMANVDVDELRQYRLTHSLSECAARFGVSVRTIKSRLAIGGDCGDKKLNHKLASLRRAFAISKEQLYDLYIVQNKDTITISEELGIFKGTVRKYLRKYDINKHPIHVSQSMQIRYLKKTGYRHPSQVPGAIAKIFSTRSRFYYTPIKSEKKLAFKSLHELTYALYLDNCDYVERWDYELIRVPYIDRIKGKCRIYTVDFSVQSTCGDWWVEIKPQENMIPLDKFLYATRQAKQAGILFRGLSKEERDIGFKLFTSGYNKDRIEIINPHKLVKEKCYTLWFKNMPDIDEVSNEHTRWTKKFGEYVRVKLHTKTRVKYKSCTI